MPETELKRDSQAQQHPPQGGGVHNLGPHFSYMLYLKSPTPQLSGLLLTVQTTAPLFSQKTMSFLQLLINSPLHCNAPSFSLVLHFSQSLIFLPLTEQPIAPALQPKSCPRNYPEMSQTGMLPWAAGAQDGRWGEIPCAQGAVHSPWNSNCNLNSVRIKAWVK